MDLESCLAVLEHLELHGAMQCPRWHIHACGSLSVKERYAGACKSVTVIVTTTQIRPLPDVAMHYTTKGGEPRSRRFASVELEEGLALVAVHVRHQSGHTVSDDGQASNAQHIQDAQRSIVAAHQGLLAAGGAVLAVGDFNGPLFRGGNDQVACSVAVPSEPTHYGKPKPVDGAMLFQAASTPRGTVACSLALARPPRAGGPTGL